MNLADDLAGFETRVLELQPGEQQVTLESLAGGHAMGELAASCSVCSCCIACCCCCPD
jgi:hypothetical protein